MGVFGLLGYCLAHKDQCVDYVDLVTLAKLRQGGIELLCDFYSFEQMIVELFWKSIQAVTGNQLLHFLGGEYESMNCYVSKLIGDLQRLNINLVMFIDGARGSNVAAAECKMETWRQRFHRDLDCCWSVVEVLTGQRQLTELRDVSCIRPVLLEVQLIETLTSCGCEIIQCPVGEADLIIARSLRERERAFAVLSNDSDFCIFADCQLIPHELFDIGSDLKLGAAQQLPASPGRLSVGVISTVKVAAMFKVSTGM